MANGSTKPKTSIGSKPSNTKMPIRWVLGNAALFAMVYLPFR